MPETVLNLPARPWPLDLPLARTALVLIDMQRDFVEPGGFGASLGNDVTRLQAIVPALQRVLAAWRAAGACVLHTREGHAPDLADCPPAKRERGQPALRIGDVGPMGRVLVQGEPGHAIIPELAPLDGEWVLDKPGKGAFCGTDLQAGLAARGITHLVFAGVTTEVCVQTTMREANDRGYTCVLLEDGTESYFPAFKAATLEMLRAQGAIVGWTATCADLIAALAAAVSTVPDRPLPCGIAAWRAAYAEGATPEALLGALMVQQPADGVAWITRLDAERLRTELQALADRVAAVGGDWRALPLYGVPYAVKDNIDAAGWPTTAACPEQAWVAAADASVVARLRAAGAVLVGKTNLDQFATGLVGTRSPYGAVPCPLDATRVSGGSSSGSAAVVARGRVPFALGTDTAGSGRVPAGFNQLVGLKPTPGAVPMQGVLPACRTIDVVSVFALDVADAAQVMAVIEGPDEGPVFQSHPRRRPWLGRLGRPLRVGVPAGTEALDTALGYPQAWRQALQRLAAMTPASAPGEGTGTGAADVIPEEAAAWSGTGLTVVPIDMAPLDAVAALLYDGPWVAERHAVVRPLLDTRPEVLDPTVRSVIEQARRHSATDAFVARYRLQTLARQTEALWDGDGGGIDVLMVPTAPTHPTLAEVAADPVARNSALGRYTNFVNLLGLAALALPAAPAPDGHPFGVTFIAPGGSDAALAALGRRWEAAGVPLPCGAGLSRPQPKGAGVVPAAAGAGLPSPAVLRPAAAPTLALAVVGAHLAGLPLHGQLVERGARLLARTVTAPHYRLHALPGTVPPKPGLARVAPGEAGHAIALEVYELPLDALGGFLALIPPPLGLGSVELAAALPAGCGAAAGRSWVQGFICEGAALAGAPDVSAHGGWRAYLAACAAGVSS